MQFAKSTILLLFLIQSIVFSIIVKVQQTKQFQKDENEDQQTINSVDSEQGENLQKKQQNQNKDQNDDEDDQEPAQSSDQEAQDEQQIDLDLIQDVQVQDQDFNKYQNQDQNQDDQNNGQSFFSQADAEGDQDDNNQNPLEQIRTLMRERNIDLYLLPRTDEHKSEYLCPRDERVQFVSGFTGSNGLALIGLNEAFVWTDGRYWQQGPKQFYDGWDLKKNGKDLAWNAYVIQNYPKGTKIQIDPSLVNANSMNSILKQFQKKVIIINFNDKNLIDQVWKDRPQPIVSDIFVHEQYAGKSLSEKIDWVRQAIKNNNADAAVFTDLSQIAWLVNLRSFQYPYNPIFKSILLVTLQGGNLYLPQNHPSLDDQEVINHLKTQNIGLAPYDPVYPDNILFVPASLNYEIYAQIKNPIKWDGISMQRAIRTQKQIEGYRKAQILDSIAFAKYWNWLQKQENVNQYQAAKHLISILEENQDYKDESFPTMSSGGPNSAIIHYFPTSKLSSVSKKDQIKFLDSGSQYPFGTTDTSRAFHFGQPTPQQKEMFTRVLLGNLDVQRKKWSQSQKITGADLDLIARSRLAQVGLNYDHGTGHGVGYFGAIHEGPIGITKTNKVVFQQNMIVTDEPGYYEAGKFGFRIQNILVVTKDEDGQLGFQNLTLFPYDKNLLDNSLLTEQDKEYINNYHKRVWEVVSPYLKDDNQAYQWLKEATDQF